MAKSSHLFHCTSCLYGHRRRYLEFRFSTLLITLLCQQCSSSNWMSFMGMYWLFSSGLNHLAKYRHGQCAHRYLWAHFYILLSFSSTVGWWRPVLTLRIRHDSSLNTISYRCDIGRRYYWQLSLLYCHGELIMMMYLTIEHITVFLRIYSWTHFDRHQYSSIANAEKLLQKIPEEFGENWVSFFSHGEHSFLHFLPKFPGHFLKLWT